VSTLSNNDWTKTLFDDAYVLAEGLQFTAEITKKDCDVIARLLDLKPGLHILDLACGHGRHTIELARRGLKPITGLDYSKDALEYARQDAVRNDTKVDFIEGDMRSLTFEAEFDVIFNVFSSMFYWDDVVHLSILQGVFKALKPDGRFLIDVYNRDLKVADKFLEEHRVVGPLRRTRRTFGAIKRRMLHLLRGRGQPFITKTNESVFDFDTGILHGVKRIQIEGKPPIENRFELRLHTLNELRNLIEHAGFVIDRVVGGPDGHDLKPSSPRWIVVAHRPA
jgi:SAM-dependent methyltransferase